MSRTNGFTIIEMLVTVSILAILVTAVVGGFAPAREQARDAQRQADLRTMEAALSLYKNKYGVYPAGCNGYTEDYGSPVWSGQPDTDHRCLGISAQYIIGLVPEFLPELPLDPRLNGDDSGYVYTTNEDQTVYKLMALNTVESEEVMEGNQFFRCGQEFDSSITEFDGSDGASFFDNEICERVPNDLGPARNPNGGSFETPAWCTDSDDFGGSYAVSAGFSDNPRGTTGDGNKGREYDTEIVRCS